MNTSSRSIHTNAKQKTQTSRTGHVMCTCYSISLCNILHSVNMSSLYWTKIHTTSEVYALESITNNPFNTKTIWRSPFKPSSMQNILEKWESRKRTSKDSMTLVSTKQQNCVSFPSKQPKCFNLMGPQHETRWEDRKSKFSDIY